MNTTPKVDIRNVRKSFGNKLVLDNISLQVDAHEVVCLISATVCSCPTRLRR